MTRKRIQNIRYGIAEWYGKPFHRLSQEERILLSATQNPRTQICPFRSSEKFAVACIKPGGVCSLRPYQIDPLSKRVSFPDGSSPIVTLCPHRFKENRTIFDWVNSEILHTESSFLVTEVGFLIRDPAETLENSEVISRHQPPFLDAEDVGQIDYVLIADHREPMIWCALELQAVYFSGVAMSKDFETIRACPDGLLPYPTATRRPDYRSSGPKRLMPQLQVKIPTLRRWGKKMGVVVDQNFYNALGRMEQVDDISNCDIVWLVVDYRDQGDTIQLFQAGAHFTTLERAVEGLTAGKPVSLPVFEKRVIDKLRKIKS